MPSKKTLSTLEKLVQKKNHGGSALVASWDDEDDDNYMPYQGGMSLSGGMSLTGGMALEGGMKLIGGSSKSKTMLRKLNMVRGDNLTKRQNDALDYVINHLDEKISNRKANSSGGNPMIKQIADTAKRLKNERGLDKVSRAEWTDLLREASKIVKGEDSTGEGHGGNIFSSLANSLRKGVSKSIANARVQGYNDASKKLGAVPAPIPSPAPVASGKYSMPHRNGGARGDRYAYIPRD